MPQSESSSITRHVALMNQLRKLWEQHVHWTRSFIISTAANLDDLTPVTTRLLRNPADFADVLSPYYGPQLASAFQVLLTQHLEIAGDLLNAAKIRDTAAVDANRKKWYENADEIAAFLSKINPYWNEDTWKKYLYSHLQMTEQEGTLRLNGRYDQDVALYDKIEDQALLMADYMFQGIASQFVL